MFLKPPSDPRLSSYPSPPFVLNAQLRLGICSAGLTDDQFHRHNHLPFDRLAVQLQWGVPGHILTGVTDDRSRGHLVQIAFHEAALGQVNQHLCGDYPISSMDRSTVVKPGACRLHRECGHPNDVLDHLNGESVFHVDTISPVAYVLRLRRLLVTKLDVKASSSRSARTFR